MMNHFSILAQRPSSLVVSADTNTMYVFLAIVVGIIVLVAIAGRSSNNTSRRTRSGSKKFNKGAFKKKATSMGMTKVQVNTLENLIERHPMANPNMVYSNPAVLDKLLKNGMDDIDGQVSSDKVKDSQKLTLFRIKQAVERNGQKRTPMKATRDLKPGQQMVLTPAGKVKYTSRIISNLKDAIGVETPLDSAGVQTRWKKGMEVNIYFWRANGQGFSFSSKVLGYTKIRNTMCVLLRHSNNVKESQQRRFRRKELDRPSYFYPVRIIKSGIGKNQVKKAFVETQNGSLGTILEVSAGGCSIKTNYPLAKGQLVKVEFDTSRGQSVKSFGKVVNFRKGVPMGGTMHIQFTRMSQGHLNNINSYIYQF